MFNISKSAMILFLLLIAAIPRFYGLGTPGFFGDEETTAYPARSMAEGNGPLLPSGMPYFRALPYTALNAVSAKVFGADRELSYRLPAALLGTLTVPVFFLLLAPLFGRPTAFIAGILLATSEWHVLTSREARMYGPFLFFFIVSAFATLRWSESGERRSLALALFAGILAATTHILAAFLALFALVPLVFPHARSARRYQLIAFAGFMALLCITYHELVETAAYTDWGANAGTVALQRAGPFSELYGLDRSTILALAFGLTIGVLLWTRAVLLVCRNAGSLPIQNLAKAGSLLIAILMTVAGQAYGAVLGMTLFLLIESVPPARSLPPLRNVFIITITLFCGAAVVLALNSDTALEAVKAILRFPHPYALMFLAESPGVTLLASAAILMIIWRLPDNAEQRMLRIAGIILVFSLISIGAITRWQGMRYFTGVYPIYALLGAFAIAAIAARVQARFRLSSTVAGSMVILICLSGALGGHGIPQAWRAATAGPGDAMSESVFGFAVYPDHRSAGLYVRSRLEPGDIVVAEDQLQQRWYAGAVDYWLRDPEESAVFLYRDPEGQLRDIYVSSAVVTDAILERLQRVTEHRIWVITSAEGLHKRELGLTSTQRTWLGAIQKNLPEYVAEDGITAVYCINCRNAPE